MSRAIEDLKHEHDAVLFALKILAGMCKRMSVGAPVDDADIAAFLGFLKEFADKCHHGKEEGLLFPALVEAGIPQEGGPVGRMLEEHVEGRRWIRDMEAATQPALKVDDFTAAARGYTRLLQAHIQKENEVLFRMAEQVLSAAELERIADAFEQHEAQVIGQGRHEELHALLKALKAKYLPGDAGP